MRRSTALQTALLNSREKERAMTETRIYVGLNDSKTMEHKTTVNEIAKDLCAFFHQGSVLITENAVRAYFVNETL